MVVPPHEYCIFLLPYVSKPLCLNLGLDVSTMFKVFVAALLLAGVNAFSPQAAFPLRRSPAQMGVRSFVRRMTGRTAVTASYSPSTVAEAWDNHFTAFGAQDLDKIMVGSATSLCVF